MQASKMTKSSIKIFFNNLNLTLMEKYLSYKNLDKMRVLLTKLPYDKVTLWIKSQNICLVFANMVPKEYLMYYLDIILAIQFLLDYRLFLPYFAYAPLWCYLIGNLENLWLDNKNIQI